MRVLTVAAPLPGHLLPLVPFATALDEAGHDVRLAAGGDVAGYATGLRVDDVVPGLSLGRVAARVLPLRPLQAVRDLRGRAGTDGVGALFGAVNAELAGPLTALAEADPPDVVVHEPLAVAGAVVAARLGIPAVLQDNTLFDGHDLVAATARSPRLRRAARRLGVSRLPPPAVRLVTAPPGLVGTRTGEPLRPVPFSGTGGLPECLARPRHRPRLLVSHSTAGGSGGAGHLRPVLAAVRGLDADVVLVRAPAGLRVPAGVRTTGRLPLAEALAHADAVVHHGGAGTVLAALATGTPQLAVPGAGDRRHNAALVAAAGAGLAVPARRLSRAQLERLVGDPALRSAAGALRAEIAAMPGPAAVAARLPALLGPTR